MKTKITRFLLSAVLMLSCTMMANAQAAVPAGDGSKGNPYQITTFTELLWFSQHVYESGDIGDDCAILMNDIESNYSPWIPIGYDDYHVYAGEFNGNGHVIKGLHYYSDETDKYSNGIHKDHCIGLFGKIGHFGSVHDVGVVDCYFDGNNRIGAICGDLAAGYVYNCWSSGNILSVSGGGGLVGSCWTNSVLKNSFTTCFVYNNGSGLDVGGICGTVAGRVENCYKYEKFFDGTVEKPIGTESGNEYVVSNVAIQPSSTFNSGKLCWLLNGGVTDGTQAWYQTIGADNTPTLSAHGTVYKIAPLTCDKDYTYSNEYVDVKTVHAPQKCTKRTCFTPGFNEEYWQCTICHKVFTDMDCTQEIDESYKGKLLNVEIDQTQWREMWGKATEGHENYYGEFNGWKFESEHYDNHAKRTYSNAYVLKLPTGGKITSQVLVTSLSFTSPKDYNEYPIIWYWYNKYMNKSDYPRGGSSSLFIYVYVNGNLRCQFGRDFDSGFPDYFPFNANDAQFNLGNLKKDDVVKIEVHIGTNGSFTGDVVHEISMNDIIFSLPKAVSGHQFKHADVTCQDKEYWECDYCHHFFSSDANPDSNVDICSIEDIHRFGKKEVKKCDGSSFVYWHCDACGKDFTDADRTKEETDVNKSGHFPVFVAGIVPTETSTGRYGYYQCTNINCNMKFKNELCSESWTNDNDLIVPYTSKNNEIWYTTTDNQQIAHGVKCKENEYKDGLGKIVLADGVTEIADNAFNRNKTLKSIFIPSSVKKIGNSSFWGCSALESVFFNSLPDVDQYAFGNCNNLNVITLDLTDSEKPYIGTSLANYPENGFTKVRYHRTLENGTWETIVLPFVPTAESIAGLEFYAYNTVSVGTFMVSKTETIEAGVPYLVKNMSESNTEFTFIAETPSNIVVNASYRSSNGFTTKGAFQSQKLNNTDSKKFYYLDGDQFKVVNGEQSVDPFRVYIETENSGNESLNISDYQIALEGDGTPGNPYLIGNGDELAMYAQIINLDNSGACGKLTADITVNTGVLDDDGNLVSGKAFDTWTPMGGHGKDFSGEFNGNGHTISGLYFNDGNVNNVGLFGKAAGGAYIHDLGIEDSYFSGNSWVAGICGDFASGTIENCWNGATVISNGNNSCAGGIAGSCWVNASVTGCYNIGKISAGSGTNILCGGICGSVAKNSNATIYSVSNCVSLEGKCNKAYNFYNDAKIDNVDIKNAAFFASGEVCWLLNGGSSENVKWHQTLGDGGDKYPTFTGNSIVYLTAKKCDGSAKAFSNTKPESVPQDEHAMIPHDASVSTCATQGCIKHRSCTNCGHLFKYDSDEELTEEQVYLPLDPDNHSLSLIEGKAHCEWCWKNMEHYLAIDNNPVLLKGENESYYLDKVELKYGHSYLCTDEVDVVDFSYTFRYNPNVWNSWFVPFEITTADLGDKGFTAAYIAGVRQYEKDAEGNVITQVDVIKIKDGYLFAGTPYLIRQESSATEPLTVTFNKTGAILKESSEVHPGHTETMTAKYDFIGTYNTIAKENVKSNYYILGSKGTFVHPSSPVYAMNWYMKIEEKGAAYGQYSSQAKAFIINVIGEEDQTTGIRTLYPAEKQVREVYDLSGRRLDAPRNGQVNIINGKKIFVK